MSFDQLARLGIEFFSGTAPKAAKDIDAVEKAADRAEKAADRLGSRSRRLATDAMVGANGVKRATDSLDGMEKASTKVTDSIGKMLKMVGTYLGAKALIGMADQWSDMSSRIGAAVKNMEAAPALMERMVSLANASYSPLEQTVEVYTRNVGVLAQLGLSANQAADFTESLNHMLVITATKGERAASVQNALSKAMAVGKLTGDGLETVLASGGRVAEALAAQLGTGVNGLRGFASQGKITATVLAGALLASLEAVREEAAEMPATVADGITRIQTGMTYLVGIFDQTTQASGTLAAMLVLIGDALASAAKWASENGNTIQTVFDVVIATAIAGVTALALRYALTLATTVVTSTIQAVTATIALEKALGATSTSAALASAGVKGLSWSLGILKAALISTGIGALVVGAGVLIGVLMSLSQKVGGFGEAWKLVVEAVSEQWDRWMRHFDALGARFAAGWLEMKADAVDVFAGIVSSGITFANRYVGIFVGAFSAVKSIWGDLPGVLGDLAYQAAQAVLDAFKDLAVKIAGGPLLTIINAFRMMAGEASITGSEILKGVGDIENRFKGRASAAGASAADAFLAGFHKNTIDDPKGYFDGVSEGLRGQADAYREAGRMLDHAASRPMPAWEKLKSLLFGIKDGVIETTAVVPGLGGALNDAGGKGKKAVDELRKEVERLNKAAAMGRTPMEKYRAELAKLDVLKKLGLSDAAYSMELERINDQLAQGIPIIGDIANAWGDFVVGGFRDFKGFVKNVLNSFKSMLAEMISTAARNRIMIGMGMGGSVTGAAGSAAAGAAGQAGGGVLGGLMGGVGGIGSALWSGAMNSLGALWGGGFGSMFASIGGQIGTALATGTATSIAAGIGAIAGPLAAVGLVFSFFSKKTKELDRGLRVTVDGLSAYVEEFRTIQTSRFWGLSKKTRTHFETAEQETQDAIGRAVGYLQSGILNAAKILDVGASAFEGFSHVLSISTKDMTEDQALKAVQDAVMELGDAYAILVPALKDQIQYSETATSALERLAGSLTGVRQMADLLGHSFTTAGIAGGVLASNLADMFGGIDAMGQAAQTYWTAVYSEEERLATMTRQATTALAALGVQMPRSRDQYRAMVEALDLSQESSHKLYAALVSMAGVMDQILPSVSGLTAALAALQGNVSTGLEAAILAGNEAAKANATAASNWYKAARSIREWLDRIRGTASALINPVQARANNEASYQATLARALAGDLTAAQDVTGIADRLLQSVNATARTGAEAAVAQARIMSDLGLLSGVGDIEGARHDVIAGLLGQQVTAMEQARDYIAAGNAMTEAQVSALLGQLGGLDEAIAAAQLINYAYLKERLAVTVDVLADADVPAYLKTLLGNAATGVTGYVDFLVRSDLAPDLKWLALTGASEHISTIRYLADNRLGKDLTRVAVDTVGTLQKTVNLLVGAKLPADLMQIALAGNSELVRTVTATLSASINADAKRLALGNVGAYSVGVMASLSPGISADVRRIVVGQQGSYAASINAAISAQMPDAARRVLLTQQGDYIANITGILVAGMDNATRTLLLNANTEAARAVTISAAFAKTLTADERAALSTAATTTMKTIRAAIDTVRLSATGALFLAQIGVGDARYQKTLAGQIALSALTGDQRLLLSSITETVTKSVAFRATGAATEDQLRLLGAVSATILRAVDFRATGGLSGDQRDILGAVNGSVQRLLGLSVTGALSADQRAILAAGAASVIRTLGLTTSGTLSDDQRRVLLATAGSVARGLSLATSGTITADQRNVLGATAATIARSLALNTTGWITDDQRSVLGAAAASIARNLALTTTGGLTNDQRAILSTATATITRTIKGVVETGSLSAQQQALLAAINGGSTGKITLGGSFTFDPTTGFKSWYESSTKAAITGPMDALRAAMGPLQSALAALLKGISDEGARQAAESANAAKIAQAQAALNAVVGQRNAAIAALESSVGAVRAFDEGTGGNLGLNGGSAVLGVGADGRLQYKADAVYGASGTDLAKWQSTFWGAGGLEAQMYSADRAVAAVDAQLAAARKAVTALGGVPAFASGGDHLGGLRIVGERGPELEATGPSRIYNAQQTRSLLSSGGNGEVVAELRALRSQNERLEQKVQELTAHAQKTSENTRSMDRIQRGWEANGIGIDPDQNRVTA